MKKIIIVDKVHSSLIEGLQQMDICCEVKMGLTQDDFIALEDQYYGLVIRSSFQVNEAVIDSKKNLNFIVRIGSGVENINTKYAQEQGIHCLSTPEGNAQAVAEHCLAFLLMSMRKIQAADRGVRSGIWDREGNKGRNLSDLTVGIIGFGHNGRAFAKALVPFQCRVLAYDRYHPDFSENGVENCSMEEVLANADVVSLHVNYIPENYYLINDQWVNGLQKPIIFINSSRGLVVDTQAVLKGIDQGLIEHACLDVLEFETVRLQIPCKEEWNGVMRALSENERVTLTPHIAGQTLNSEEKHASIALRKIVETMRA